MRGYPSHSSSWETQLRLEHTQPRSHTANAKAYCTGSHLLPIPSMQYYSHPSMFLLGHYPTAQKVISGKKNLSVNRTLSLLLSEVSPVVVPLGWTPAPCASLCIKHLPKASTQMSEQGRPSRVATYVGHNSRSKGLVVSLNCGHVYCKTIKNTNEHATYCPPADQTWNLLFSPQTQPYLNMNMTPAMLHAGTHHHTTAMGYVITAQKAVACWALS